MWKHVLLLALILSPSSSSAQSLFIQASAGADIRRFSDEAGKSAYDGTARAFAFGAGDELTPHWVVSAEADLGARSTTTTTTSVVISGQDRDIHNAYTSERRSISALAGYRTDRRRRVQFGVYGGVSFSVFRREIVSDAAAVVLQQSSEPASVYEDRLTGPIVGVDVAVRVASHIAIVPALRAQGLTVGEELGGHSVRPSVGVRITF